MYEAFRRNTTFITAGQRPAEGEEAVLTPQPPLPLGEGEQNRGVVPLSFRRGAGGEDCSRFIARRAFIARSAFIGCEATIYQRRSAFIARRAFIARSAFNN